MRGSTFAKMAVAMGMSPGNASAAIEEAERRWGPDCKAAQAIKGAVAGATTGNWGGPLIGDYAVAVAEFLSLVRENTITGRLQGLRRLPHNTPYLVQSTGTTGAWVGEGQPMPIAAGSFTRQTLGLLKVTAAAVQTEELFESPNADSVILADLVRAVAAASDTAFIDSDNAGVAGEQPASVTYNVTATDIGTDMAAIDEADLATALAAYPGDFATATWVAHPELLIAMSNLSFPQVNARTGGTLKGLPVIPSRAVPKDSGGKHQLVLLDPAAIAYTSDDAATQIKATHQGSIEMDSAPTQDGAAGTGSAMVSLWQSNCVALAALVWENWRVERDGTVLILNTTGATS